MLLASGVDYELRTTLHPDLLGEADIEHLALMLAQMGARNYALQVFRPTGCADAPLNAAALAGYPGHALLERIAPFFQQLRCGAASRAFSAKDQALAGIGADAFDLAE